jgi:hypothetical protein
MVGYAVMDNLPIRREISWCVGLLVGLTIVVFCTCNWPDFLHRRDKNCFEEEEE